jgi:hypothetical protein
MVNLILDGKIIRQMNIMVYFIFQFYFISYLFLVLSYFPLEKTTGPWTKEVTIKSSYESPWGNVLTNKVEKSTFELVFLIDQNGIIKH